MTSVNENTPRDKCTVRYPDFNKAIELCLRAGRDCKISKSDMRLAFRNLGLRRSDWKYLIMMCELPLDGKIYYFVNKCLPFGASVSCAHFQAFSDAISHILRIKSGMDNVNYLDDFLFVALLRALCDGQIRLFLQICNKIGFPVSMDKTFWSNMQMTFLGFLINTVRQIVLIPADKLEKAQKIISETLQKSSKKITLRNLQKICGFLNFLGRCIVPGRAFTQ